MPHEIKQKDFEKILQDTLDSTVRIEFTLPNHLAIEVIKFVEKINQREILSEN